MILYKYIFITSLIFINLIEVGSENNPDLLFETGLENPSPLSIGLIFFVQINNTSDNVYDLEIKPDECCLEDDEDLNCDYLKVLDGCKVLIANGSTKTLKIVAPLLDVFERKGHCTVLADSKSNNEKIIRNTLTFQFDTKSGNNNIDFPKNYKFCEAKDADPFNNCEPVNCDTYYNSQKSYFSRKTKRCLEVPSCVSSEDDSESPDIIYNPITNKCIEEALIDEDLNYVKSLSTTGKLGKHRKAKEVLIIRKYRPNATDFFDGVEFVDDVVSTTTKMNLKLGQHSHVTKLKQLKKDHTTESVYKTVSTTIQPELNNDCMKSLLKKYILNNRYTFIVVGSIVTVQCFLICTMFYCLSKTCNCFSDKKVVRKFFNYRQDASVTTPLIGTSNIDTETTDYQYVSDSSNVDQKVKCYKACQKEINNTIKVSMSDDILSKCLNRRDWKKVSKSEAVTKDGEISQKILDEIKETHNPNKKVLKKNCETKVVFEDEIAKEQKPKVSMDDAAKTIEETKLIAEIDASSEKEIKCHSYNCYDANVTGLQPSTKTDCYKSDKWKRGTISLSTEKGAQAYFSNDSIDDFLSERGVMYLAGENVSKYTFSSDSNDIKPSTESSVSSKTSKNFVKNVLSLLHKRSKQGPSSDPGQNKKVDLELIHMSRASVYTSSNDSDCVKTFKRKDSRTSF